MKILVLSKHYYPEPFTITEICEELVRRGHDVLVVTGKPHYGLGRILEGYEKVENETINGVRIHRVNIIPRTKGKKSIIDNYLSYWRNSKRYIKKMKEEFDVVFSIVCSPIISASAGNIYAKKHHIKHVHHCMDLWPESVVATGMIRKNSLLYKIIYSWSKKIYKGMDHILISSPSFKKYFDDVLKIKDKEITYMPQPALLAKQVGSDLSFENKYNIIYEGNVGFLQLVENFISALPLVKGKYDLKFHIIGHGERMEEAKELAKKEGVMDMVIFHGKLSKSECLRYHKNCTGFLCSLHNDGWVGNTIPNKVTSSLKEGKPILGIIQGDGKKLLEEAGGSIFAKDESKESIALAIEELLNKSEEERKAMGEANRKFYEDNLDFKKIVDELENHLINASKK